MAINKQRKICIYCGCKRVTDKMEFVGVKHGRYFQAGKEIEGYVCTYKQYISDKSCLDKFKEENERYKSAYHEPVRVGK